MRSPTQKALCAVALVAGAITLYFVVVPRTSPQSGKAVPVILQKEKITAATAAPDDGFAAIKALAEAIVAATKANPNHEAKWDDIIRDLAHRYATTLQTDVADNKMSRKARAAFADGCHDPFVRYLAFRYNEECTHFSDEFHAKQGLAIVEELQQGAYPPVMRAYAAERTYYAWRDVYGYQKETAVANLLSDRLWQATFDALHDPAIPERINRPIARMVLFLWQGSKADRDEVAGQLESEFVKRYGDCATVHYLRSAQAIKNAWDARGAEYADKVKEAGWKIFTSELAVARQELELAWKLDPREVEIAKDMITVCMGLGLPRPEMEQWFDRGVSTGHDASSLCVAKLYYLAARWHGSFTEQVTFARECLGHPQYGRATASLLWNAHVDHRSINGLPLSYFAEPDVWADIKLSLATCLEHNPDLERFRMQYCYHAWLAKDWPIVSEQLALFDPAKVDLTKIGGRTVYDQIVTDKKKHTEGRAIAETAGTR
ncbi:MAG: hypothetical protein ABI273_06405 [Lacunisphaera sp.]